ncbi:hypothetical protein I4U23_016761 [Adineta vaga]|nr:hypothetical protein I4U23_016761 [Adineta vaga]
MSPQCSSSLRCLSLNLLRGPAMIPNQSSSSVLKHQTHVSLKLTNSARFNYLEPVLTNFFPLIKVLNIAAASDCLNAYRWEHLISIYLVNLRILNVLFLVNLCADIQTTTVENQFKLLSSSFWTKRQCFFDY